jgi:hypothetical protein
MYYRFRLPGCCLPVLIIDFYIQYCKNLPHKLKPVTWSY